MTLNQEQFNQYSRELNELRNAPPAPVMLPPLAAIAIVIHIQLASRHPSVKGLEFTEIAIDTARQLQELFSADSQVYRVLELGWNPENDRPTVGDRPDLCETPCEDFLANRGCRCTGYKVAEVVHNDSGQDIPPEVLAQGVAMMEQVKRHLEDLGFETVGDET